MVRPGRDAAALLAAAIAAAIASGIVIVIAVTILADYLISRRLAESAWVDGSPPIVIPAAVRTGDLVNRERKGDALPVPPMTHARKTIKSVEVVGIRDAAIIYRDRHGNILFKTDPVTNVTVVAKNVELPEVTVRETSQSKVDRMPVDAAWPPLLPPGCESAFAEPSPVSLTRIAGRCLAQRNRPTNIAAIR